MYLVSITYKVKLSEIDKYLSEHIKFIEKFYDQGIFFASGPKVPRTGGIILAEANSKEILLSILSEDPFLVKNLAVYEITEFVLTRHAKFLNN